MSYAEAMKKKSPPPVDDSSKPERTSTPQISLQQNSTRQLQPQPQKPGVASVPQPAHPRNPRSPWGQPGPPMKVTSKREEGGIKNLSKVSKELEQKKTSVQILSKEKLPNQSPLPWKTNKASNARQALKTEKASATSGPIPKAAQSSQHQPKRKKPKPQLKAMSIGDMIAGRPNQQKPKKVQQPQPQPQPNKSSPKPLIATDSISDFPALGASPSVRHTPKLAPPKPSWGKPAAASKLAPGPSAASQPKKSSGKQPIKKGVTKSESATASSATMFFQPKSDAPREGDEHQLLRLLQDRNVYQKKGRQRLHPRKKKFTALKKKVLQERLQKWYEMHPEEKNDDTTTTAAANATQASCSVCIYNYVHPDDLEDDDEYNEILTNLRDLTKANRLGPVKELFVPRVDRTDTYPAFVRFESAKDAAAAQACLEGLVVGGEALRVILVTESANTGSDWKKSILLAESSMASGGSTVAETSMKGNAVIELSGILTEDDYGDEECMSESLGDLREMAAKFGKLQSLEPKGTNDGGVLLQYEAGPKEVEAIFEGLKNTTIGGKQLSVTTVTTSSRVGRSVVVLENVLTEDDLEDEDCLNESIGDIRELAGRHGVVIDVQVMDKAVRLIYEGPPSVAENSAKQLNGMTLAGEPVVAHVQTDPNPGESIQQGKYLYLYNILTEDDLEDEDCLQESLNDIRALASKHGTVRELGVVEEEGTSLVRISYADEEVGVVKSSMKEFDGMVVGGLIVTARSRLLLDQEEKAQEKQTMAADEDAVKRKPDPENDSPSKKARTDDMKPLYSGDKLIPERFAQAKRVPKVPTAAGPREYANQVNDERVRPLLTEMLGELMRLQKRAVEENNTKAKRRLVLGLREVARGIRSHKVKLVIIANNLDEYGAIDEKLQEIIDLAHNEGVPLFFEFTKRSLGKAVGKSIKVAVVGIQNAEGAHQPFKKLVSLAPKI